jgi:hypothetical protein
MFSSNLGQSFHEFHQAQKPDEFGTQPIAVRFRGI